MTSQRLKAEVGIPGKCALGACPIGMIGPARGLLGRGRGARSRGRSCRGCTQDGEGHLGSPCCAGLPRGPGRVSPFRGIQADRQRRY